MPQAYLLIWNLRPLPCTPSINVASDKCCPFAVREFDIVGLVGQVELFAGRNVKYGIWDKVDKVKQVSAEVPGLPGYSAWLLACLYGVPVHSYVCALPQTLLTCLS